MSNHVQRHILSRPKMATGVVETTELTTKAPWMARAVQFHQMSTVEVPHQTEGEVLLQMAGEVLLQMAGEVLLQMVEGAHLLMGTEAHLLMVEGGLLQMGTEAHHKTGEVHPLMADEAHLQMIVEVLILMTGLGTQMTDPDTQMTDPDTQMTGPGRATDPAPHQSIQRPDNLQLVAGLPLPVVSVRIADL